MNGKTLLERLRKGDIPVVLERLAGDEGMETEALVEALLEGRAVVPSNLSHAMERPCVVGGGSRVKVNANLGTSSDYAGLDDELAKLKAAVDAGADAVMDLSTGGPIDEVRKAVVAASPVPVGTVPIYQAAVRAQEERGSIVAITEEDIFRAVEDHCASGVDFITVHCGVTMGVLETLKANPRVADIVSRGGAFLAGWILHNERENPLYEQFDRLLEIAHAFDAALSLGDGFRPGCVADATDRAQIQELIVLGELAERARKAGVQVMIEGPGHVPLDQIASNIALEKRLCHGAPFYVLGPIVTDVAPGYDHITAAIGGALAAFHGADFLCYVTPSEHLRLPSPEDVWDGVMASRIAAHAADLAKGIPGALHWDRRMARHRKCLDWEGQIREAIDPERARRLRESSRPRDEEVCTMCSEFCAIRTVREAGFQAKEGIS